MSEEKKSNLFQPGQSGNPRGRPKGSKNKENLIRQALREGIYTRLEQDFQEIYLAVLAKAKDGDMSAAKLLWESVMPKVRQGDKEDTPLGGITIVVQGVEQHQGKTIQGEVVNVGEDDLGSE